MIDDVMSPNMVRVAAAMLLCVFGATGLARAQSAQPDLAGTYQCRPNPDPCLWPGKSVSISQSGSKLEIKNEKGETAPANFTSDVTLSAGPPFNTLAVIRPDHSIDWSNGTKWQKQ